jgi:hypothetical protein
MHGWKPSKPAVVVVVVEVDESVSMIDDTKM